MKWPVDTPDWLVDRWDVWEANVMHEMTNAKEPTELYAVQGKFRLLEELEADIEIEAGKQRAAMLKLVGEGENSGGN